MAKGKMYFNVERSLFSILKSFNKITADGDFYKFEHSLDYLNGSGIYFSSGDILYEEGQMGTSYDLFSIVAKNNEILGISGNFDVIVSIQFMAPPGTLINKTPNIFGASFDFEMLVS